MSGVARAIAGRELRGLFVSPLAWTLLAGIQVVLAYVFLGQIDRFVEWQPRLAALPDAPGITALVVAPVLRTAALVLLVVTPLVTMRLAAGERRAGTMDLLLSSPVSCTQIAAGKFGGAFAFLVAMIALTALMPASLLAGANLDGGQVAAGYLGLTLLAASFCSLGLLISTLTRRPSVAASATYVVLLILWLLDRTRVADGAGSALAWLSPLGHLDPMLRGVVDTRDLAYFAILTLAPLVLAARRLDAMRLHG